jgi:hypothetical protein
MIPFPFAEIEPVAAHVRNLGYFAWKPIVIQVGFFFFIKKNIEILLFRMPYDVSGLSFMVIPPFVITHPTLIH